MHLEKALSENGKNAFSATNTYTYMVGDSAIVYSIWISHRLESIQFQLFSRERDISFRILFYKTAIIYNKNRKIYWKSWERNLMHEWNHYAVGGYIYLIINNSIWWLNFAIMIRLIMIVMFWLSFGFIWYLLYWIMSIKTKCFGIITFNGSKNNPFIKFWQIFETVCTWTMNTECIKIFCSHLLTTMEYLSIKHLSNGNWLIFDIFNQILIKFQ